MTVDWIGGVCTGWFIFSGKVCFLITLMDSKTERREFKFYTWMVNAWRIFCWENYAAAPATSPEPRFQTFNQNTGRTIPTVPSVFDCCMRATEATMMFYTPKQGERLANYYFQRASLYVYDWCNNSVPKLSQTSWHQSGLKMKILTKITKLTD